MGENFTLTENKQEPLKVDDAKPSSALLDLNWSANSEFLGSEFMPSKLMQESFNLTDSKDKDGSDGKSNGKIENTTKTEQLNGNHVSWLTLFAELDPLANPITENNMDGDRV